MPRAWKVLALFVLLAASAVHADPDRLPQRNPEPAKPAPVKVAPTLVKTTNAPASAKTAAPNAPKAIAPAPKTASVPPPSAPKPPPPRCLKLSGVDRMVCEDAGLARLDAQMNVLYRKALAEASDPGGLKASHQDWVELQRDRCGNVTCLRGAYQSQIAELRAFTSP